MNLQKQPKVKKLPKCKVCKQGFEKRTSTQQVCSYNVNPNCSIEFGKQKTIKDIARKAKEERVAHREARVKARPLQWYKKAAERACNAYIKLRDLAAGHGCISCGTKNPNIQYCAGHYRTVKASPQTRYNEDNIHLQCNFNCNSKLSGNIINYRPALIGRIGQERFDAILNNHESGKYTIPELIEITRHYTEKAKELKKD